jgi:hypothetical protein
MRICINPECGWTGPANKTVHPKHSPEELLCPECYEVTEDYSVEFYRRDLCPGPALNDPFPEKEQK